MCRNTVFTVVNGSRIDNSGGWNRMIGDPTNPESVVIDGGETTDRLVRWSDSDNNSTGPYYFDGLYFTGFTRTFDVLVVCFARGGCSFFLKNSDYLTALRCLTILKRLHVNTHTSFRCVWVRAPRYAVCLRLSQIFNLKNRISSCCGTMALRISDIYSHISTFSSEL